jgi:hypothetical protein
MSIDGLKSVTQSGLRGLLMPFVRWLREFKAVELPGDDKDIVDEWVGITMGQLTSTVGQIASLFKSDAPSPGDAELPVDNDDDDEVN